MRATTFVTPNCSRATRAEMMLELSPLETAANASAESMAARWMTARAKPRPVTVKPVYDGASRRNASGFWSIKRAEWSRASRFRASVDPTRPHPMITTCTTSYLRVHHAYRSIRTGNDATPDRTCRHDRVRGDTRARGRQLA